MLKLTQMKRNWGLPNMSPACMKLESWLRLTGIPYELSPPDMAAAPKGKIPYIVDGGARIGDSTLIIEHLKRTRGVDPDAWLDDVARATALAVRRMLKESSYWVIVYFRWIPEEAFTTHILPLFLDVHLPQEVPLGQREVLLGQTRQLLREQLHMQGMGRHSFDEVAAIGRAEMTAVADLLGDKPYLMGDRPCTADTTAYAYVANILEPPVPSPVQDLAASRANLVSYCRRMRDQLFPELPARA